VPLSLSMEMYIYIGLREATESGNGEHHKIPIEWISLINIVYVVNYCDFEVGNKRNIKCDLKEFLMNYCGLRLGKKKIMELYILNETKYLSNNWKFRWFGVQCLTMKMCQNYDLFGGVVY